MVIAVAFGSTVVLEHVENGKDGFKANSQNDADMGDSLCGGSDARYVG